MHIVALVKPYKGKAQITPKVLITSRAVFGLFCLSFENNSEINEQISSNFLTAGADYILFCFFYHNIKYQLLNTLRIKREINQHDLKLVDPHFVKSE